jgi:hypothetical protein
MQKGSGVIPIRWRCVPKQSCSTHKWNSATAFLLGQSRVLAISRLQGFWDSFEFFAGDIVIKVFLCNTQYIYVSGSDT